MEWYSAFWIIVTGSLVAGSCALLGCFLVLRNQAMLGDAISHAILPGIVVAFWISGGLGPLAMFAGAVVTGLLTTFIVQLLSDGGVERGAAMGVTFTSLFALGVAGVSAGGHGVHLDLECVLYGEIAYAPFDPLVLGGTPLGPRAAWINGGLFLFNALLVSLLYKEYKIATFDPGLAAAAGVPVMAMHYLLMSQVALTVVGAFESVGVILVVAMLIAPAAAAYLLADRLGWMLVLAVVNGVLSSAGGYAVAAWLDCSIAGAMASVSGLLFALAFLFAPAHGVVTRWIAHGKLRSQVAGEDVLLWAGRHEETGARANFSAADLLNDASVSINDPGGSIRRLQRTGHLASGKEGFSLTRKGREAFHSLIKRHRLYETYLDRLGYPPDHLHEPADRVEHHLDPKLAEALDRETRHPGRDPQGKAIPRRDESG